MRWSRFNHIDLLRYAGLFTFASTGLPLVAEIVRSTDLELARSSRDYTNWALSYVAFGIAYWSLTHNLDSERTTAWRWFMMVVISLSTLGVSYFSGSALAGILLLVMAGVLPWMMSWQWALVWLIVELIALIPIFSTAVEGYSWIEGMLQSSLYIGFSSFTLVTAYVAKNQAEAREEQRRLNSELRATRALLAESTRMHERVRISRELHDLLGHHLTALSLNLEVASHLVQGQPQDHVRQAQSLAKLLLSDVREVVSQLRQDDEIDLRRALSMLAEGIPVPAIHLEVPERFATDDPRRAQVLLRCAQETITNTIRHARANNLWLKFGQAPDGTLRFSARDDGRGAEALAAGNGVNGMRERLAQVGGELTIDTAPGRGFSLHVTIPTTGGTPSPLAIAEAAEAARAGATAAT